MHLRPMTAIYLTRGEQILLLYRMGSRVVGNCYTGAAGGHMGAAEYRDPRSCVLRELQEETGLAPDALENLELRYISLRNTKSELRQNYYYFAALKEGFEVHNSTEGCLAWYDMGALDGLPMPVTARYVVEHYIRVGRFTKTLYGCLAADDGPVFAELNDL